MTYCVEHPSGKMLLMPVEMSEPNPRCYVCSETPLVFELNTAKATMRDVIEKVVKRELGVSDPVIMQGSSLLHEAGEDIEDMVAYYAALLDKKFVDYPIIATGVVLTVEDYHQDFRCSLHIKHRCVKILVFACSISQDQHGCDETAGETFHKGDIVIVIGRE